jgi:hypothetical protein
LADLKKQPGADNSWEEEKSKSSSTGAPSDESRVHVPAEKEAAGTGTPKSGDQWVSNPEKPHPSRKLEMRSGGYGIAAGYEKPYKRLKPEQSKERDQSYGPIPHSGYYGSGEALRPFKFGQAGFDKELDWYRNQYGRETSGYAKKK